MPESPVPLDPPPGLCKHCVEHPLNGELDRDRLLWYCPHNQVMAVRGPADQNWMLVTGITPGQYHRLVKTLEEGAKLIALYLTGEISEHSARVTVEGRLRRTLQDNAQLRAELGIPSREDPPAGESA